MKFMDCLFSYWALLNLITINNIYIIYIKYVTLELYLLGCLQNRQATHANSSVFWILKRNRLAAWTGRQATHAYSPSFLGFCMIRLAVMSTRQATREILARFWCFWDFGCFYQGKRDPYMIMGGWILIIVVMQSKSRWLSKNGHECNLGCEKLGIWNYEWWIPN